MSTPNNSAVSRRGRDLTKESSWRDRLNLQLRSGLTVRAFCKRQALKEPAFYFWRREIGRRDAASRTKPAPAATFVELRVTPTVTIAPEPLPAAIELILPRDRRLVLRSGFDAMLLRQVLSVLDPVSLSNREDRSC